MDNSGRKDMTWVGYFCSECIIGYLSLGGLDESTRSKVSRKFSNVLHGVHVRKISIVNTVSRSIEKPGMRIMENKQHRRKQLLTS